MAFGSLVCLHVLIVAGCGSSDGLVPVSGVITHDGQPVPALYVKFESAGGDSAWATTDQQGRYELRSTAGKVGVKRGAYRVWVEYRLDDPGASTDDTAQKMLELQQTFGRDSSTLQLEVPGATSDLNISLDAQNQT